MNSKLNTRVVILSALLCSIGIIIPMFSPIKIVLEPASFTLASHVPIFMAMFISPGVALFVTIGTSLGFLLGGFPITVVLRALSHVLFIMIGSIYLKNNRDIINENKSPILYPLIISLIHALGEILIVIPFYFGSSLSQGYYDKGFVISILGLIGVGTIIHSMIDFYFAKYIWKLLPKSVVKKIVINTQYTS